jgi:hypothetical protein
MNATILRCEITRCPREIDEPLPEVRVMLSDGSQQSLFRFYPDEINFEPSEFIGLTLDEARALYGTRDRAYLKSQ